MIRLRRAAAATAAATVAAVKSFQVRYSDPKHADGDLGALEADRLFDLAHLPHVTVEAHS